MALEFALDGAEHHANALTREEFSLLETLVHEQPGNGPGTRIFLNLAMSGLVAAGGNLDRLAKSRLGAAARPVRALLFDKRPDCNWAVGWHQDRSIAVRTQCAAAGFGPWTRKAGVWHVEPPFRFIDGMVTLRVHLDACDHDNAPLLIVPGSHRLGRISVDDIPNVVERLDQRACLANAGDIWLYATPIVHASRMAAKPRRRRVLQVDYSAHRLPGELEWLGL